MTACVHCVGEQWLIREPLPFTLVNLLLTAGTDQMSFPGSFVKRSATFYFPSGTTRGRRGGHRQGLWRVHSFLRCADVLTLRRVWWFVVEGHVNSAAFSPEILRLERLMSGRILVNAKWKKCSWRGLMWRRLFIFVLMLLPLVTSTLTFPRTGWLCENVTIFDFIY